MDQDGFRLATVSCLLPAGPSYTGLLDGALRASRYLTGLSVLENPPTDKDILGRWKPEGSDTYARSYGGRVARLQAIFAIAARARNPHHYEVLDERELLVVSGTG